MKSRMRENLTYGSGGGVGAVTVSDVMEAFYPTCTASLIAGCIFSEKERYYKFKGE